MAHMASWGTEGSGRDLLSNKQSNKHDAGDVAIAFENAIVQSG
jgi:hypothetical protein